MKQLIRTAFLLNYPNVLDILLRKVYNQSKLDSIIYGSEYQRLGGGVINKKYLDIENDRKIIENIVEHFISIQSEEEFNKFLTTFKNEKFEAEKTEIMMEENWKKKLREVISESSPSTLSPEEKEEIFNIVINAPNKKSELKNYYWKVFDKIGIGEKTRNIFNVRPDIQINKNDFPQKSRI